MIETLFLAGGAFYATMMAYRALREKPKLVATPQPNRGVLQAASAPPSAKPVESIGITTATLGLATAGALLYSPLNLVTIPLLLYLTAPDLQRAWRALTAQRRIDGSAPAALIPLVCMLNGVYVAPALGFWLLGCQRRFLRATEASRREKLCQLFDSALAQAGDAVGASAITLRPGARVTVDAGELIPVDGIIIEGSALVGAQNLKLAYHTQHKQVGDAVFAATLVQAGRIYIQAHKAGQHTLAAQLGQQLCQAVDAPGAARPSGSAMNAPNGQAAAPHDASALPLLMVGAAAAVLLNPLSAVALMNTKLSEDAAELRRLALLNYLQLAGRAGVVIKVGSALPQLAQADTLVLGAKAIRRPEAAGVIKALRPHFAAIYLLASSNRPFSRRRSHQLGADDLLIADTDEAQAAEIARLQHAGQSVCYVGDGEGDRQAMHAAAIALSLGCADQQAADAADILLLAGDLHQLVTLYVLAVEFDSSEAQAFQCTFASGALNLASVLFLQSGLIASFLFRTAGFLGAMTATMLPAVDYDPAKLDALLRNEPGWRAFFSSPAPEASSGKEPQERLSGAWHLQSA